jgi:hypothetical protein
MRRRMMMGRAWTPAKLFTLETPGFWYDIQDLSTLFQDAAGTVPAEVGDPVYLIRDKSGANKHATANDTTTARAILGQDAQGKYYLPFTSTTLYNLDAPFNTDIGANWMWAIDTTNLSNATAILFNRNSSSAINTPGIYLSNGAFQVIAVFDGDWRAPVASPTRKKYVGTSQISLTSGSSRTAINYVDGVEQAVQTYSRHPATNERVISMSSYAGSQQITGARLYSTVFVSGGLLSDDNRELATAWLAKSIGVTL